MREDAIFEHDLDFLGMVIFLAASELAASCRRVVTWVGLSLHTDLISLAMPLHPLLYIIAFTPGSVKPPDGPLNVICWLHDASPLHPFCRLCASLSGRHHPVPQNRSGSTLLLQVPSSNWADWVGMHWVDLAWIRFDWAGFGWVG